MGRFGTNNFSGGMNNWASPWTLDVTQCVDLLNGKINSKSVVSTKGHVTTTDLPDMAQYLTADRSVLKFSGRWFWSDNVTSVIDSTVGYVGILPPAEIPQVTPSTLGFRFTGTYRYAVTFETADGFETCAFFDGATLGRNDAVVNTSNLVEHSSAVEYPSFSMTNVAAANTTLDGYTIGDRVMHNGVQWECTQTFTRTKSAPLSSWEKYGYIPGPTAKVWIELSETTLTVDSTGYDVLLVSVPQPVQSIVTLVNLYRSVKNGGDLYLVATLPVGQLQYTDVVSDLDLLSREPYGAAPALGPVYVYEDAQWVKKGGKYLTSLAGVFYCAYGDRLYISEQDNPNAWNPVKYLLMDDDITAIGVAGSESVLVMTKNRVYKVTGTTISDIVKEDLKATQGCPNWRTLTSFRNQPVWVSYDGLCGFTPAAARDSSFVTILTEGRYRFEEQPNFGVTANDTYYAFYDDHAVCFDFRNNLSIYRIDVTAEYAIYDPDRDRLLFRNNGSWYWLEGGASVPFSYLSPEFTGGGLHGNRHWRQLWVNADSPVTVTPFIDGIEKSALSFSGTGRQGQYLPAGFFATRFQLLIEGTGTLRSLEIEVTPLDDKITG
jgi:hypothetical protein